MTLKIGALTIGQSPRPDLIGEMKSMLGKAVCWVEAGALDGLSMFQINDLLPRTGETLLVTRLKDGRLVKVAEERILSYMQAQLDRLDKAGCQVILLLCTGTFSQLHSRGLLLRMDALLMGAVNAVAEDRRLGILCPDSAQFDWMRQRWEALSPQVEMMALDVDATEEACQAAGRNLRARQVDLIVMDCMGYTHAMKEWVFGSAGLPVILARSLAVRILQELYLIQTTR